MRYIYAALAFFLIVLGPALAATCRDGACGSGEKTVSISEITGSRLEDVQVRVVLDTASMVSGGALKSDCSDMLFVDTDHGVLKHYLANGCNTDGTTVFVRLPELDGSATHEISLRHGNTDWDSTSSFADTMTPLEADASTVALWYFDEGSVRSLAPTPADGSACRWTATQQATSASRPPSPRRTSRRDGPRASRCCSTQRTTSRRR